MRSGQRDSCKRVLVQKWGKISGITSKRRALVRACYTCKLLSCLLVGLFFAEPSDEVEEGEQDEAGWTGHGRVPRIELKAIQAIGDPKMRTVMPACVEKIIVKRS